MQCLGEMPSNVHNADRGMELSAQFKIIVFNCNYLIVSPVFKYFIHSELEACERRSRNRVQMVSASLRSVISLRGKCRSTEARVLLTPEGC